MKFECTYDYLFGSKDDYCCLVTKVSITGLDTEIPSFAGKHRDNKTNNDVTNLTFYKTKLEIFPRNLHKVFPNLLYVVINHCGLEKISHEDLVGLEKLKTFYLIGNNLTTLPDDLFVDMKKLKKIVFSYNQLEFLSSELLKPVAKTLEYADFSGNVKIDDYFNKDDSRKRDLAQFMQKIDQCTRPEVQVKSRPEVQVKSRPEVQVKSRPEVINDSDQVSKNFKVLMENFRKLRESGDFTDFTIKVLGKEFKVHKCIVAAQSSVFEEMFKSETADAAQNFTKIQNFSEKTFKKFLDYFYNNQVEVGDDAMKMFELASEFKVQELKKACVAKILTGLSESNALEVFNLGHRHDSEELKRAAFEVIKKIFPSMDPRFIDKIDAVNNLIAMKRQTDEILKATSF